MSFASETQAPGALQVGSAPVLSLLHCSHLHANNLEDQLAFAHTRSCTKSTRSVGALRPGTEQLTVEAAVGHLELLKVGESAPSRRNPTSKRVRSSVTIRVVTRQIENLKRSWKHRWQRTCANKTPNSVATIKSLSMDAGRLTAESAKSHFEFLEVRQSAPFRRNSTSKLVRSIATASVATRQIENLKRRWKHLWQRTYANTTSASAKTWDSYKYTNLTAEAHVRQDKLLELGKFCHIRCDGPSHFRVA